MNTKLEQVHITIDGKLVSVPKGIPLIEAIDMQGKRVPRLCYHPDFYRNGTRGTGSCGLCVVKNKLTDKIVRACTLRTSEGMNILTNSTDCITARKTAFQLILANHPLECFTCVRNNRCELQTTAADLGIRELPYQLSPTRYPHEKNSLSIQINPNKCIKCGRCVITCKSLQLVEALEIIGLGEEVHLRPIGGLDMDQTPCISCGQCTAHCPVAGIYEKDDTEELYTYLRDPDCHTVVQMAPAVRVSLGEEFGLKPGTLVTGKLYTVLRTLGFDKVFDTNFGADITITEEASEFAYRFSEAPESLPIITSCCPSWVNWCEKFYPDLVEHLASTKSPHQMLGVMVKTYYAEKMNIDPTKIKVVSIMPCTSKKSEIKRHPDMFVSGTADVDLVVTARELARMIREAGIDFNSLEASEPDQLMGEYSGAGAIFGTTGGVLEAALRTSYYNLTNEDLPDDAIDFQVVRGFEKNKIAVIPIKDKEVTVAVAHGMVNVKEILDEIREAKEQDRPMPYDFVEIMACYGGCLGGGGQPYAQNPEKARELRSAGLYTDDKNCVKRSSHTNPMIIKLYEEYLDHPMSAKAYNLLHTHHEAKPIIRTKEDLAELQKNTNAKKNKNNKN